MRFFIWLSLLVASQVLGVPTTSSKELVKRQSSSKLVFAHFIVGIVWDRTGPSDWDADMQRAKAYGIDAFALDIGTESNIDQLLGDAYASAANNGMKLFISFDFGAGWSTGSASAVGAKIAQYASESAQLLVNGKPFASSFAGGGVDVSAVRSAAGIPIYFAPNFYPGQDFSQIDSALSWGAWDSNGANKAPVPGGTTVTIEDNDNAYVSSLAGKPYVAPISPWFFTHYGAEVSYPKNWVFPSDLLWYSRWESILSLQPQFLEIITWNDYGESHYIGPLSSKHGDDGASKWVNDMPHDGWLDMAKPFIAAYKAGASSPNAYIANDQLVYWYRPELKSLNCDSTDTTMAAADNSSGNYFHGKPDGWNTLSDSVFVVALLTQPGVVIIRSGDNTQTFDAPAGATAYQVSMQVGQQQFTLSRNGNTVLSGVSLKDISATCICGEYNYNAFVGTVPLGFSDPLYSPDGFNVFTTGLNVACAPTPSLPATPAQPTTPPPTTMTGAPTMTTSAPTSVCTAGTTAPGNPDAGNQSGLCSYACNHGYCPAGPCVCTGYGAQVPEDPITGVAGYPLAGEDASYIGLCSYVYNHGYYPTGACTTHSDGSPQ
ncbi:putative alpha-1,3-glucanase/mutanase [Calycina marina]|uniref:Alpha-1,3-glucanase/mutanase n=1 Tax=Calycina marina TaxID=1763456 RepID=A0A9P7YYV8_9HELO|nr:putative alpha-1,3-glucanase/mutanase [Calycina marina]